MPMSSALSPLTAPPHHIALYDEGACAALRAAEVAAWLHGRTGIPVNLHRGFLETFPPADADSLARRLAQLRVTDPTAPRADREPLHMEVQAEQRALAAPGRTVRGVLYDGFALSALLADCLPPERSTGEELHVAVTARLIGSWDTDDLRWHARTSIYGRLSLISTTGLVQAPARPREYYLALDRLARAAPRELVEAQLQAEFRERCLQEDDERLTEVLKGYALQALLYHLTGEPFCAEPACRLYNAHWQAEMLRAQLEPPELCPQHEAFLGALVAASGASHGGTAAGRS